ncbi:MAG: exo-alpha-sialidase [Pirellulales bacterium]|nr:exo-alpha-sialidase [Pirellulales bacterium]
MTLVFRHGVSTRGSLIAAFVLLAFATVAPAQDENPIRLERVFGSEAPGPYKHPASIEQLAGGDLYLVYYGGSGEYADDTAVYGSRRKEGEGKWSAPAPIADTPFRSEGNGVIWQAPDGLVWLFYNVRYGETWSTSRIQAKISRDGAETWSDPIIVAWEEGMMVRSRPVALADGDFLLPVYHETGHDTEKVGDDTTSLFLRYDHKSGRFTETNRIHARRGCLQPAAAQVEGDYFVCYNRRGGDYEPTTDGYLVRSESRDGGRTWSEGVDTKFPNPNSAVDFLRLLNGHLLLIYNDNMNDRTPLTAAISTDGDQTYPHRRNLVVGPGPYAYPFTIQAKDGTIHCVYTTEDRTLIMLASFKEEAVLGEK